MVAVVVQLLVFSWCGCQGAVAVPETVTVAVSVWLNTDRS